MSEGATPEQTAGADAGGRSRRGAGANDRAEPARGRIAIAPTPRAGSVLLTQLLTDLGLDTGFGVDRSVGEQLRAGGSQRIESLRAPRIVTDLDLNHRLGTLLAARAVSVDHVIVPVRALDTAAASRVRSRGLRTRWNDERDQIAVELYELVDALARFDVPHTFLAFPRFAEDWQYLADQLGFLDPSVPAERWREVVDRRVDPERIHESRLTANERLRTVGGSLLEDSLRKPARTLRRWGADLRTAARRARPDGVAAGAGPKEGTPDVAVHVASINTVVATELCIRSMREYAGWPFDLFVGDCGSTDGSLEMLEAFAARGWLQLEVAPNGRMHAEWLDQWLRDCPARFAVFVDSDIEFLGPDWLADMVRTAHEHDAALVCAQMLGPRARYVHPHTGAKRTLGPRPAPWLLLLDTERLRGRVDASFEYLDRPDAASYGGKIGYDVGGGFFAAVRAGRLGWVEMPLAFRRKFVHFSGLSWRKLFDLRAPMRMRPGQVRRLATVYAHLARARALRFGERAPVAGSAPGQPRARDASS